MLDIPRLKRIKLNYAPLGQRVVSWLGLWPNYNIPPRVRIELEGAERVPAGPVIYAMNHTDRYNYFPFQFALYMNLNRFTATWVKGKYYENSFVGGFMEITNQLPTVSRGYLIARDFLEVMKRPATSAEYSLLRRWVDSVAQGEIGLDPSEIATLPEALLKTDRDVLGYEFEPFCQSYPEYINAMFGIMMDCFIDLNESAFACGLDLLIFPQGTRSIRLSKGHIGMAEMALHLKATIVPVGCNGSDKLYPGASPFAKSGRVVYRIGEPIPYEEMSRFHIAEDFKPFDPSDENRYRKNFQGLIDHVMKRIDELLDAPYKNAGTGEETSRQSDRFL